MKEYELLRQEILDKINAIVQYNILLYTATTAVLAFAFEKENPFLCLLPYVVILPIYLMVEELHNITSNIAAYMIVFLEGTDHNWETRYYRRNVIYYGVQSIGRKKLYNKILDKIQKVWSNSRLNAWSQSWTKLNTPARIPYVFMVGFCFVFAMYKAIIQNAPTFEKAVSCILITVITLITVHIMITHAKWATNVKQHHIKRWQMLKAEEEQEARKRDATRNPQ